MRVYIVVLPWDYSSAEIKGVFKNRAKAVEKLKELRREQNGDHAFISTEETE